MEMHACVLNAGLYEFAQLQDSKFLFCGGNEAEIFPHSLLVNGSRHANGSNALFAMKIA